MAGLAWMHWRGRSNRACRNAISEAQQNSDPEKRAWLLGQEMRLALVAAVLVTVSWSCTLLQRPCQADLSLPSPKPEWETCH